MAIRPYRSAYTDLKSPGGILGELSEHALRTKAMLTALGDYWTAYYRDLEALATASSGSVAAVSREYTRLLDMVLSANVLDIPIKSPAQFDLLVFDEADLISEYDPEGTLACLYCAVDTLVDITYLTSTLFEPGVVLQRDVHFTVVPNEGIRFFVDLFQDQGISQGTYQMGSIPSRKMLFWASEMALSSTMIYERYGRFLYAKADDSEKYKWLITALMHFYTNTKSTLYIQNVLNIMFGVPYVRNVGEVVEDITWVDDALRPMKAHAEAAFIRITTNKNVYYTYAFSEPSVTVGDRPKQFQLLSDFHKVSDYISEPKWWRNAHFPKDLISGDAGALSDEERDELMETVLKHNLVYIKLGVTFESYDTYVKQVKEVYQLIKSGFPVYLYPLLDTFFRIAFADDVDVTDLLSDIRMRLGITSQYTYEGAIYDGVHTYYMLPTTDHGRTSVPRDVPYDGDYAYTSAILHRQNADGSESYDADTAYTTDWLLSHNASRDNFDIRGLALRETDSYNWNSPLLSNYQAPLYDGLLHNDGEGVFHRVYRQAQNDNLHIYNRVFLHEERIGANDNVSMHSQVAFAGFQDFPVYTGFSGAVLYSGEISATGGGAPYDCAQERAYSPAFLMRETYAWASQLLTIHPIFAYNSEQLHNGIGLHGPTALSRQNDTLRGKITTAPLRDLPHRPFRDASTVSVNLPPEEDSTDIQGFSGANQYSGDELFAGTGAVRDELVGQLPERDTVTLEYTDGTSTDALFAGEIRYERDLVPFAAQDSLVFRIVKAE